MLKIRTEIDSLSAPADDGQTLIWPDAGKLTTLAEDNRRLRLGDSLRVLDRPLSEWLPSARDDAPITMTGHQPAFFHPGVWAKNIVSVRLAARLGGRAEFIAVDSDVPQRLALQWPECSPPPCRMRTTRAIPELAGWAYQQFPPLSHNAWRTFFDQLPQRLRTDSSTPMPAFNSAFLAADSADYMTRWMSGLQAMERLLGVLSPRYRRVSEIFDVQSSPLAAAFIGHVLINALALASDYNAALTDYRMARGIVGSQHPIPDLSVDADRIELPLWILGPSTHRRRAFVARNNRGAIDLYAGDQRVAEIDQSGLRKAPGEALADSLGPWRLYPRALMLTMFCRLFACDLFIHGVGGAKYDQLTDAMISRFFGVAPPSFACVTATLRLPLPRHGVSALDLANGRRRLRDLRFNPQRYMDHSVDQTLLAQRSAAIAEATNLRGEDRFNRAARRSVYEQIHQINDGLLALAPKLLPEARAQSAELAEQFAEDRIANWREWFLGLYSVARLESLSASLPSF